MDIEQITDTGHTVLIATGRLDTGTAPEFEKQLLETLPQQPSLVVDLSGVDYISSAGLRVVLMGAKRAKQAQGKLVLCGLSPAIREVFAVSGFLKILDVRETRDEAVAALQS